MTSTTFTLRIPMRMKQRGYRRPVQYDHQPCVPPDPVLVALARAWQWQQWMREGRYSTVTHLAAADLTFGVEIETVGRSRETVAQAIQSVVGGAISHIGHPACYDPWEVTAADGRVWRVLADSSLTDAPTDQRAEVVTPELRYADLPLLQQVIRAVRACGAKATPTCGLHCHVGAERFTGRTLANLVKLVHKQEELVFAAFGVTPEWKARYDFRVFLLRSL